MIHLNYLQNLDEGIDLSKCNKEINIMNLIINLKYKITTEESLGVIPILKINKRSIIEDTEL